MIFVAEIIGRKIILSRCACLGLEVLGGYQIINRQKYRIDLPWSYSFYEKLSILLISIQRVKSSIYNLIAQQSFNLWDFAIRRSDYFVMDTYSELTDRLYIFNKSKFCCHRSDLLKDFKYESGPGELIDGDNLANGYKIFFKRLRAVKPDLKIIVILFPVKFDTRERYRRQYDLIKRSLEACSDMKIKVIELEDSKIHKDSADDYPYHFDSKTIDNFRLQVLNAMKN
jgi:hypothetical protein